MDDTLTLAELRQLVRQQLEGLRLSGVEWLPLGPPVSIAVTRPSPASSKQTLFTASEPEPAGGEPSLEKRRVALELLAREVEGCQKCAALSSTRSRTVFADGLAGAELCLVGEAPGADEDAQGIPFVGAAGQLLNRILAACGLKREEVYICNTLKCRPPKNRTPTADEMANCRDFFVRQLDLVRPKYIIALGSSAAKALLETSLGIGRLRGRFHDFRGIPVMVTYHPSFLLPHRSPEKKKEVWEDMQWLMAKMGREIPGKK